MENRYFGFYRYYSSLKYLYLDSILIINEAIANIANSIIKRLKLDEIL